MDLKFSPLGMRSAIFNRVVFQMTAGMSCCPECVRPSAELLSSDGGDANLTLHTPKRRSGPMTMSGLAARKQKYLTLVLVSERAHVTCAISTVRV